MKKKNDEVGPLGKTIIIGGFLGLLAAVVIAQPKAAAGVWPAGSDTIRMRDGRLVKRPSGLSDHAWEAIRQGQGSQP